MKKTLMLMGLFISFQTLAQAQSNSGRYRPYLHCESSSGITRVLLLQNVNAKDVRKPYQALIEKGANGKVTKYEKLNVFSVPIRHKDILALFEGASEKGDYRFQLYITREESDQGHPSYLYDNLSARRTLYCNQIIAGF